MDPQGHQTRSGVKPGRSPEVFEVVYRKGDHLWRFGYEGGQEAAMIEAVRDIMRRERGLDWVDVAMIAHEIRVGVAVDIVRVKDGYR
jgi:hypothetical protein